MYRVNLFIEGFLTRNGFKKMNETEYANMKCVLRVLKDCYEIEFTDSQVGEVITYSDGLSIPQLAGVLSWHNLIDRNYSK
jgi:hypothetical protein